MRLAYPRLAARSRAAFLNVRTCRSISVHGSSTTLADIRKNARRGAVSRALIRPLSNPKGRVCFPDDILPVVPGARCRACRPRDRKRRLERDFRYCMRRRSYGFKPRGFERVRRERKAVCHQSRLLLRGQKRALPDEPGHHTRYELRRKLLRVCGNIVTAERRRNLGASHRVSIW